MILPQALCADEEELLFFQGDLLFPNSFAGVTIAFESCIDREDLSNKEKIVECAPREDIKEYM